MFSKAFNKVLNWDREVVAKRAMIVGAITIILNVIVAYGWLGVDFNDQAMRWVGIFFDAATALSALFAVRPAVTPVKDPKNNKGEALVPSSEVSKAIEEALAKFREEAAQSAEKTIAAEDKAVVAPAVAVVGQGGGGTYQAPQPALGNAEVKPSVAAPQQAPDNTTPSA